MTTFWFWFNGSVVGCAPGVDADSARRTLREQAPVLCDLRVENPAEFQRRVSRAEVRTY